MNDYLLANKENLNWSNTLQTMNMKETNNHEENKTKLILFLHKPIFLPGFYVQCSCVGDWLSLLELKGWDEIS